MSRGLTPLLYFNNGGDTMAEKNNAVCSICGNPYYLCMSCRDSIKVNPWKVHCDTAPHYQVYQVIHGYNTNVYTKDEAKNKFKNINLDDMDTFRPHIKKVIEDILKELDGLFNINDVEKYIGYEVYSDQDITLDEDEFLVDDLIGLTVYNEQKELIGEVLDVISIPSNDILEIKTSEKKILIPFINDYIVEITDEYIIIKELEIV